MPVTPSYPGLYIEELPLSAHSISAAPTSITVIVGYTPPVQDQALQPSCGGCSASPNTNASSAACLPPG